MADNIYRVTPFMHVDDVAATVRFFVDLLGFRVEFQQPNYAYVRREQAAFRILQNQGTDGAPPGNRRFAYYIDVEDVAAIIAEVRPRLTQALPHGDIMGPVDQPYGQREFMIVAPDGNLLVFGQAIA